jgi:hypothetical protein
LKNPSQKIRLAEWLKVKALSSSPRTAKKKNAICLYIYMHIYFMYNKGTEKEKNQRIEKIIRMVEPNCGFLIDNVLLVFFIRIYSLFRG